MWESLAVAGLFMLILLFWWIASNPERKEDEPHPVAFNTWTSPIGVVCITLVYIVGVFVLGR